MPRPLPRDTRASLHWLPVTTPADSPQTDPAPGPDLTTSDLATPHLPDALAALPIQGVPHILRDGPNSLVVRDDPPDGVAADASRVLHLPRHESAAAAHRLRTHLLPYVRGHLSAAIPLPEPRSAAGARWGFTDAAWLPGEPFLPSRITDRNEDRLAQALGQFLAELHAYPAERAQSLGVPGPRDWRAYLDGLRQRSRAALRPQIGITERGRLRAWWTSFLAGAAWTFPPALSHTNLEPAHLLLDAEARDLQAVLGWSGVAVADAALDVAAVSQHYGADFAWLVLEAYRRRGGPADAGFLARVRRQAALLPLLAWDRARDPGESPPPDRTQRLLEELRRGPILASA